MVALVAFPAKVIECETGYNTEKGVECYEATKGEGALVYQPAVHWYHLSADPESDCGQHSALHTMGYGRTSAANGKVFSNVFNFPANYWNAASLWL